MARRSRLMYEFAAVMLALVLLFSGLTACGGGDDKTTTVPTPIPKQSPAPTTSAIPWSEVKNHIGERTTVYGPVIGATYASSSRGQPTFLNVGRNYPDPARFTVLIWGSNRSRFSSAPEIQYRGKTIYVYGLIELYQGSAQIVVTSPDQIQVK